MTEAKRKPGRPAYVPTDDDRQTVEQMKFVGESDNTVARALSIDVATLRKYFSEELSQGYALRKKEVVGLLFTAARKGNVAAIKRLDDIGRAAGAVEAVNEREAKSPKIGKKEERQAAAERVGGKFAPPEPPRLVVAN